MSENSINDAINRLKSLVISDGTITTVNVVSKHYPKEEFGLSLDEVPDYLRVCVTLNPSLDSNIKVEGWLPINNWNGCLLGTGNGGYAGTIDTSMLKNGVRLGFASFNTDLGTSPNPDTMIGKEERWKDFGYRATHLMTVVAKQIICEYYQKEIRYSYFTGGSTGGQQGLMEAQRYPEDYNGILVCAPANDRVHLHIAFIWDWLIVSQNEQTKISMEQSQEIFEKVLEHYGHEGGAIGNEKFMNHSDKLTIDTKIFEECKLLSRSQINALKLLYSGTDRFQKQHKNIPVTYYTGV